PEVLRDPRPRGEAERTELVEAVVAAAGRDGLAPGGVEAAVPGEPADAHAEDVAGGQLHGLSGGGGRGGGGADRDGRVSGNAGVAGDIQQHAPAGDAGLRPRVDAEALGFDVGAGASPEEAPRRVAEVAEPVPLCRALREEVVELV